MNIKNLPKTSKIAILGFGKEGQSSLDFLARYGFTDITILDSKKDILYPNCKGVFGDTYLESLSDFDIIIKSPGISPYQEKILPHIGKIISQTQIFFEFYSGKVIGITGTKGKSTVSSLVYQSLKQAGYKTKLVGNIGNPVLEEVDVLHGETYDYVVYEFSSYMLESFCPHLYIGYINNIHPCHLDWHTTMDIYSQAKYNILKNADHTVVHTDLSIGDIVFPSEKGYSFEKGIFYRNGSVFMDDTGVTLLGEHNRINICGVLSILEYIIPETEKLRDIIQGVLQNFSPLPHRLENIGKYKGVDFIDDAIAVTPEATIAAIQSTSNLQTLLVGGKDIGMDQHNLEETIKNSTIENIILFPETGYTLFSEYTQLAQENIPFEFTCNNHTIRAIKTTRMEEAIKFAFENTHKGKSVLLSSAAQSYSLWKNFEEKGNEYKKHIEHYAEI